MRQLFAFALCCWISSIARTQYFECYCGSMTILLNEDSEIIQTNSEECTDDAFVNDADLRGRKYSTVPPYFFIPANRTSENRTKYFYRQEVNDACVMSIYFSDCTECPQDATSSILVTFNGITHGSAELFKIRDNTPPNPTIIPFQQLTETGLIITALCEEEYCIPELNDVLGEIAANGMISDYGTYLEIEDIAQPLMSTIREIAPKLRKRSLVNKNLVAPKKEIKKSKRFNEVFIWIPFGVIAVLFIVIYAANGIYRFRNKECDDSNTLEELPEFSDTDEVKEDPVFRRAPPPPLSPPSVAPSITTTSSAQMSPMWYRCGYQNGYQ